MNISPYSWSHTNSTVINMACIVHTYVTLYVYWHTRIHFRSNRKRIQSVRERELEDKNIYWNMYELLTAAVGYEIKWTKIKEKTKCESQLEGGGERDLNYAKVSKHLERRTLLLTKWNHLDRWVHGNYRTFISVGKNYDAWID